MLLFFVALVLGAASPALPADGAYSYAGSLAGQPSAKTTITVNHAGDAIRLTESAAANVGGDSQTAQTVLALDASLAPTSYTASYTAMGKTLHSTLTFNGTTAKQSGDAAPSATFTLPAGAAHFVVLDGSMFSGFFALPSQLRAWGNPAVVAVAPMFNRSYPIAVDPSVKPRRPAGVPATDEALAFSSPIAFTIWYDPTTFVVDEMDAPGEEATVIRQH